MIKPYPPEPIYLVSDGGFIYSRKWDKFCQIALRTNERGYKRATLMISGKEVYKYIHAMVLETFIGPCPAGMECRHLDGNKINNRVTNLRWGSRQENCDDKRRHGTALTPENNPSAKLTWQDVDDIRLLVETHDVAALAALYGMSRRAISDIKNGISWKQKDRQEEGDRHERPNHNCRSQGR